MKALGYAPTAGSRFTHTVEAVRASAAPAGGRRARLRADDVRWPRRRAGSTSCRRAASPSTWARSTAACWRRPASSPTACSSAPSPARATPAGRCARIGRRGGASRPLDSTTCSSSATCSPRSVAIAGRARRAVRQVLAYYLWRVEGVVVDESGADPDAVAAVRRAVADGGGPEAGAAAVADALIDMFAVAGHRRRRRGRARPVRRRRSGAPAGLVHLRPRSRLGRRSPGPRRASAITVD